MAVVDIKTGRIVGTKEGSWTWWHEKGHIEFDKTRKGFQYGYLWLFSIFAAVVFGAIYSLWQNLLIHIMYLVFAVLAVYYYVYEEIWCWYYAIRNKRQAQYKKREGKKEQGVSVS